jgi:hypothetical protein
MSAGGGEAVVAGDGLAVGGPAPPQAARRARRREVAAMTEAAGRGFRRVSSSVRRVSYFVDSPPKLMLR